MSNRDRPFKNEFKCYIKKKTEKKNKILPKNSLECGKYVEYFQHHDERNPDMCNWDRQCND